MPLETISVVIPAFNAAKTLDRALSSVLHQEHLPDEVIVIDDGSSDATAQVARGHPIHHAVPTKVIRQANQGVSSARNLGITTASCRYVALLDADDEFCRTHIRSLRQAIAQYPDVTLYFSAIERCFDNDSDNCRSEKERLPDFTQVALRHWPPGHSGTAAVLNQSLFNDLLKGSFIPLSTAAFPKNLHGTTAQFKTHLSFGEDRDFLIRTIAQGSALFINQVGAIIHRDGGNVSSLSNSAKNHAQRLQSLLATRELEFIRNNANYSKIVQSCIEGACKGNIYHASFAGLGALARAVQDAARHTRIFSAGHAAFLLKNTLRALVHSLGALLRPKRPDPRGPASPRA